MADNDHWTTIESCPGVFTELITEMGVQGVQMEELYTLDKQSLDALRPVYGLIFLFKWRKENDARVAVPESDYSGKVFFAQQVISNACATQAILSVLLNRPDLHLGPDLMSLRDFTADFPPDLKGLAIGNSEAIRRAHNSFLPPQPIVPEEARAAKDGDDVYHFISYLPIGGTLYELDGLKPGPISLGECSDEDWLERVRPVIQRRIEGYKGEVRFNLMAVIRDRRDALAERIASLQRRRDALEAAMPGEGGSAAAATAMDVDAGAGAAGGAARAEGEADAVATQLASVACELKQAHEELAQEHAKAQRWHDENIRRKTNYIPLLFNLLRLLAEKGQLQPLVRAAKDLEAEKRRQAGQN
ncbi:hypothetical protein WJX81_007242 [Elliptochloris bilobata]|uniref:Ubiquitin carboxyl-terminal hydrolase n=1 Tax=Elliptochloris bilobata TaxID=381761 RepID=A0AAW1SI25_9CHLO